MKEGWQCGSWTNRTRQTPMDDATRNVSSHRVPTQAADAALRSEAFA